MPATAPGPFGPPPIGRLPTGLLTLLSLQSGGRYPQYLLEALQPVIDVTNFYVENAATWVVGTNGGTMAGSGLSVIAFTVPATERWLITDVQVEVSLAAGITRWAAVLARSALSLTSPGPWIGAPGIAVGPDRQSYSHRFERPVVLQPQETVGVYSLAYAGAGVATVASSAIRRLVCSS